MTETHNIAALAQILADLNAIDLSKCAEPLAPPSGIKIEPKRVAPDSIKRICGLVEQYREGLEALASSIDEANEGRADGYEAVIDAKQIEYMNLHSLFQIARLLLQAELMLELPNSDEGVDGYVGPGWMMGWAWDPPSPYGISVMITTGKGLGNFFQA